MDPFAMCSCALAPVMTPVNSLRDTAARLVALCYQIPRDIRYMLRQLPRRATFRPGELRLLTKSGRNGYSQVVVQSTEANEYEIKKSRHSR